MNILRPTFETVMLDVVRVAARAELSKRAPFVAEHLKAHVEETFDRLALQLTSSVLGRVKDSIDIDQKWPADWWQAVRERWAPKWWLKRHPVRYESIKVHKNCYRVCPHLNVPCDDRRPHVEFLLRNDEED